MLPMTTNAITERAVVIVNIVMTSKPHARAMAIWVKQLWIEHTALIHFSGGANLSCSTSVLHRLSTFL
jgi:hypothetical protein